ncbi:MAG: tRNA (N6-isopentenyl adenosine(37)-C2)-methylthiotransferase MiaB [Bacillota bacterium]
MVVNKKSGHSLKYFMITYGCQMNEHDSEVMAGILEEMGYRPAEQKEEADIILINTCCVRETAENKVYGLLGQLRKLKMNRPDLIIGVGGCMTQQEAVAQKIKNRFPYVDLIFGTRNLPQLKELIERASEGQRTVVELLDRSSPVPEGLPIKRVSGVKAWVVITYGCNNFCTYCIVPYVRGRECSRHPDDIIAEVKNLAAGGYKEVTLLGQNVNSYGRDLPVEIDFAGLLAEVNKIEGIERIRFTTSHPRDFTARLIDVISRGEKICEHIHLPVQSGSNHILQMMNRGYTREDYLELTARIRKSIPGVAITTDIMVGFPGETDEDFAQTLDLVEEVRFDSAFMFVYNTRPGTPAARMPGQVEEEVKRERIKTLIEIQNGITKAINRREEGKIRRILVDGESKTNPQMLSGRTRTNKLVVFPGSSHLVGKFIDVKIVRGKLTHLEGIRN